jgi:uncharacterized protein with PIN domain
MQFIADVMLGRLAKRLRLLGFDVLYGRTLDDDEIIRISLEEGRIVLTRDRGLAGRPLASNHFFINSDAVQDQLAEVLARFPADRSAPPLTRCSACNTTLTSLARHDARDLVPSHVYENHEVFTQCPECGRVYWTGSHVRNMALGKQRKRPGR